MTTTIQASFGRLGTVAVATALAGIALIPAAHADTAMGASATEYVWQVDMRGKPPYKRERVAVPVVDVAAMEIDEAYSGETVVVWERDTSGKPPFKRRRVEVPVVDTASMEIVEEPRRGTDFRGRPPFRRHR